MAAELNRRFNPAPYPVRGLDSLKPPSLQNLCAISPSLFRPLHTFPLARPTRRTHAVGALRRIVSNLETIWEHSQLSSPFRRPPCSVFNHFQQDADDRMTQPSIRD
jgi:hypothetical protein